MDPQQLMMMLMQMQQQQPRNNPLAQAFGTPPMFGGSPIQPSQMFDLSGMGLPASNPMGQAASMLLQGILPGLMGPNFTPGQFAPTQNLYDHRMAAAHFLQRRRAVELAAQADQETYFRMIRGMARMQGIEYAPGGEQEQAARRFSQDISTWGPILGEMMPEFFDRAHGVRGSAQMMARNLFEAGRYTFDPVSGRLGQSGDTAGAISREAFNILYGQGANLSQMRGLGAGRAGQMYDELVRRGFGPSVPMDRSAAMRELQEELARPVEDIRSTELQTLRRGIGRDTQIGDTAANGEAFRRIGTALESLGTTNPEALDAALRSFNATRVASTIENMAGAVAAMRDIFGDMGRPNAPMLELLNGLQSLTQGGMAHMTPAQLETSVRRTYAIARATGLGLEGIMGLAGTAATQLEQLGTSRALAPEIAQGTAAFAFGYGLMGQPRSFGIFDREQAAQMDLRLRTQASVSPQAIRLAALMQFGDTMSRPGGQVGFAENTEARAIFDAIRARQNEYTVPEGLAGAGQTRNVAQSSQRIIQILQAAGVNPNDAAAAIVRPAGAAAETIFRDDIASRARESQGQLDAASAFGTLFTNRAAVSLTGTSVAPERRDRLAATLGPAIFQELQALYDDPAQRNLFDQGREVDRNQAIATRLQTRLGNQLRGVSPEQLANLVQNTYNAGEDYISRPNSPMAGLGRLVNAFTLNSRPAFALQRRTQAEAAGIASLQAALTSVGQEGLISRISDYVQNVGQGGGSVQDLIYSGLGGIPTAEAAEPLEALIQRVVGLQREFESAPQRIGSDPEALRIERERILDNIRLIAPAISGLVEGNVGALDPYNQGIVDRYQADRAHPPAPPPGSPAAAAASLPTNQAISESRRTASEAEMEYGRARTGAIAANPLVVDAQAAQTRAQSELTTARTAYTNLVNTPAVQGARATTDRIRGELNAAEAAVAEANAPGSTVTAEERARRVAARNALRTQLTAAVDTQTTAETAARTQATATPEGAAIVRNVALASGNLETAQGNLQRAQQQASVAVDRDPGVMNTRQTAEQRYTELNALLTARGLPNQQLGTPQQIRLRDAQNVLRDARETALNAIEPVAVARSARDEANVNLQGIRGQLAAARADSPAITRTQEQLEELNRQHTRLTRQLDAAITAQDRPLAARLRRELAALTPQLRQASTDYRNARQAVDSTQAVIGLRREETEAQHVLAGATQRLTAAEQAAEPQVSANAAVQNAQLEVNAAQAAGGAHPPGTPPRPGQPGIPPGPGAGASLPTGPTTIASSDLRITGQTVALSSSGRVDFSAVDRVTITARELHIERDDVQIAAADLPGGATFPVSTGTGEEAAAQHISGTLTLEGLDRVVLNGTIATSAPADPRSADV